MSGRSVPKIETAEEKHLVSHLENLADGSEYEVTVSSFLNRREREVAASELAARGKGERLFFYGGALTAFRKAAVFLPDWMMPDPLVPDLMSEEREILFLKCLQEREEWEPVRKKIVPLRLSGSGFRKMAHRDWLGSLMALGVKREMMGDIVVLSEWEAMVFVSDKVAEFLCSELHQAASDSVKARRETWDVFRELPRKYVSVQTTVASARLDGVVHGLSSVSRSEASALILQGKVLVNDAVCWKCDMSVEAGDFLTVRGVGKYWIDECDEKTVKGRLRLRARKFI